MVPAERAGRGGFPMRYARQHRSIGKALGLLVLGLSAATADAATTSTVVYDSVPTVLPGNVISEAFEATSTVEFGDKVRLGAGGRKLDKVKVIFSSWGCEGGDWTGTSGSCVTTPSSSFTHPLTLNIYSVAVGGGPGPLLATKTVTPAIPYRPSAFGPPCLGERWSPDAGATCFNGFATPVEWDFSGGPVVNLPSNVIWTVAFNTSHYGSPALGELACFTEPGGCGYDSLNVGAETFVGSPFVGADLDPDGVIANSSWGGAYCDGGVGGTGTLREDTAPTCWTPYRPLAEITTIETSNTVVVTPSATSGWGFIANGDVAVTSNNATANIATGPGAQPGGLLPGSVLYSTESGPGGKPQLFAPASISGTKFADVTSLNYSTLISRYATDVGASHLTHTLNVVIDLDGNTGTTTDRPRLVFEPCYTIGCGGPVQPLNTWTTWTPLAPGQIWWATSAIPGTDFITPSGSYVPLDSLYAAYPDAKLLYFLVQAGQNSGGAPWNNFEGNLDGATFGSSGTSTVYDFEPLPGAAAGSLVLGKAVLKLSPRADRPTGSANAVGILQATDTQTGFETAALAGMLTLTIEDSGSFNVTNVPVTGCAVIGPRRSITCRNLDRTVVVKFQASIGPRKPTGGPYFGQYVYTMSATVKKLAQTATGTTQPVGPVHVVLHESPGIDREDLIGDLPLFLCTAVPKALRCREK
jgi:hypothetical protein